ncbi:MAG: superoxide dismutase family protein [Myxococcales bacterium]
MILRQAAFRALPALVIFSAVACGHGENPPWDASEVGEISPFGAGEVTGTVSFSQRPTGVRVKVTLENCPDGSHPVHIHQGTSCADAAGQGGHWGPGGVRGEGIPNVVCADGTGSSTFLNDRTSADQLWTLDGNADTDPLGHAFVVHAEGGERIGCGVIEAY